jgi:hypothetical protein
MLATQAFLTRYGWLLFRVDPEAHKYHLDDDRDLPSSALLVEHVERGHAGDHMPYSGRAVGADEIEHFYGREVQPPYPRYIHPDGQDYSWLHATGLG